MKLLLWFLFSLALYGQGGNYIWRDSSGYLYYGKDSKILFKSEGLSGLSNNIIQDYIWNDEYFQYKIYNPNTEQLISGKYYYHDSGSILGNGYAAKFLSANYIPEENVILINLWDEKISLYKYDISKNEIKSKISGEEEYLYHNYYLRENELITLKSNVSTYKVEITDLSNNKVIQLIPIIPTSNYYTPDHRRFWYNVRFQIIDSLMFIAKTSELLIYNLNNKEYIAGIIGIDGIEDANFLGNNHKFNNKTYFFTSHYEKETGTKSKEALKVYQLDLSSFEIQELFSTEVKEGYDNINCIGFNVDYSGYLHFATVNHRHSTEPKPSLYSYYCINTKTGRVEEERLNQTKMNKIILGK